MSHTTPVGAKLRVARPSSCGPSQRSISRDPKPLRAGVTTGGPSSYCQRMCRRRRMSLPATRQAIVTLPASLDSAPYLVAFVASS
jgi:hypothetical protein